MKYKELPESHYFTETDLKKILLEILDEKQHPLILTLKRKTVIKEIINNKEKIIGKYLTEEQIKYLQKKKEKNREPKYLRPKDIELIKEYFVKNKNSSIKRMQHDMINVFLGVGLRVQELCDFEPGWVDTDNLRIKILGKGKKWRWTHVSKNMINLLLKIETEYVVYQNDMFKNSYGMDYTPMFVNLKGKPFTPRHIQKFMETISRNVDGLSHKLHPHLLRHTYAVSKIMNNPRLSIEELKQDMGHEDINTTAGYFALTETERIKMAKKREENVISEVRSMDKFCIFCGNGLQKEAMFCSGCGKKQ